VSLKSKENEVAKINRYYAPLNVSVRLSLQYRTTKWYNLLWKKGFRKARIRIRWTWTRDFKLVTHCKTFGQL